MAQPLVSQVVSDYEVTALEGSTFCRSGRTGDIAPRRAQGLFVKDTRLLSRWTLLVDDQPIRPLSVLQPEGFALRFIGHTAARQVGSEPTIVIERERWVGNDMREDISLRNHSTEPAALHVSIQADADFADLFAVKAGRPRRPASVQSEAGIDTIQFAVTVAGNRRAVRISASHNPALTRDTLSWRIVVPPQATWRTTIRVTPVDGADPVATSFPEDIPPAAADPAMRLRTWDDDTPNAYCANPLVQKALDRSVADLGVLRIYDSARPGMPVSAAGAPWFMTLFGRDSLLTSMMCLPWNLELARGTLYALAERQGTVSEPLSEAEPGKILHEIRLGMDESTALGGSSIYFGSVDSTPLFVMLLEQAARWGLPDDDVASLIPAADAAIDWIRHWGDADGDGFIEYRRKSDKGLINQGWKDSFDSVNFRSGQLAEGPIALAEVQGYCYAAFLARAALADRAGADQIAARCRSDAAALRERFNEAFWIAEGGYYALALDGDKRAVDSIASNQAHCLWTGIVDEERAASVVSALMAPTMFSGWGIRTLDSTMGAYNPISYHNGSVWPHDNALAVAGLARYGFWKEAAAVAAALIDASGPFEGRLPELYCGFARADLAAPIPYPSACSPQAWASASVLGIVATLLDLQPDSDTGTISATSALPQQWGQIRLTGIPVGSARVDIDSEQLTSYLD